MPNGLRRFATALLSLALLSGCHTVPVLPSPAAAGATPAHARSLELPLPAGGTRNVLLADRMGHAELSDGRHHEVLPVSAAHVRAIGVVSAEVASALARSQSPRLALTGPYRNADFQPDSLELLDSLPARATPALPLYAPILPRLQGESFGSEARAALAGDAPHPFVLACRPGAAPAGARLSGALQGLAPQLQVALRLRLRATDGFTLLVADGARDAAQDPLPVAVLPAAADWQQLDLPLPAAAWQTDDWRSLTLTCPAGEGRLEIAALELVFADRTPSPGARALWVWSPAAWREHGPGLLDHLGDSHSREVFVTVPLADDSCGDARCAVATPEALGRFLAAATQAGIAVWAVAGDPRAVLPEERASWTGRAGAYARFNRTQPPGARLAGVQYDVEAYLLPGYARQPDVWNRRYLELLDALRAAAPGLPLDAVVPWWFGQGGNSPPELLEAVASRVDRLTVMDYRTDSAEVVQAALPFLAWGQRHGRSVHLAVECGPLPDLESRSYAPARQGELWLLELDHQPLYVLLDAPLAADAPARVFAAQGAHLVKAGQTTFHDRPEALWRLVARLEDVFAAASAFGGMAIHGLDQAWY